MVERTITAVGADGGAGAGDGGGGGGGGSGAGVALALLPTPRAQWPNSTPRRPIRVSHRHSVAADIVGVLDRLAEPPHRIEADGVAVLHVPRDADVSARLSMWTGYNPTGQTRLATLPLPKAEWDQGTARIRLQEASGRILLDRDHIDAPTAQRTCASRLDPWLTVTGSSSAGKNRRPLS